MPGRKKSNSSASRTTKQNVIFWVLIAALAFLVGMLSQQIISERSKNKQETTQALNPATPDLAKLQEEVIPKKGYVFKINWGDLGKRMVEDGVIDPVKFTKAVTGGDTLPADLKKYLDSTNQNKIELNEKNAQFWVDLLWALGLANKNELLEKGPMAENSANYASTGGWTIGAKGPMDIYSKSNYISLSAKQQAKVAEIAGNIYRPCCGNSTAFPDCNHGMAALGLVELMVSQNKSDDEIYKTVLAFNSYWFPQTYLDVSYHFAKNGREYKNVPAKEILSKTFSSAMGYSVIQKEVGTQNWPALQGAGRCGA